jgi:hypothetical protein
MDVAFLRPGSPPNILVDDKPRPRKHTPSLPPVGSHWLVCLVYLEVIIIEISLSMRASVDRAA